MFKSTLIVVAAILAGQSAVLTAPSTSVDSPSLGGGSYYIGANHNQTTGGGNPGGQVESPTDKEPSFNADPSNGDSYASSHTGSGMPEKGGPSPGTASSATSKPKPNSPGDASEKPSEDNKPSGSGEDSSPQPIGSNNGTNYLEDTTGTSPNCTGSTDENSSYNGSYIPTNSSPASEPNSYNNTQAPPTGDGTTPPYDLNKGDGDSSDDSTGGLNGTLSSPTLKPPKDPNSSYASGKGSDPTVQSPTSHKHGNKNTDY